MRGSGPPKRGGQERRGQRVRGSGPPKRGGQKRRGANPGSRGPTSSSRPLPGSSDRVRGDRGRRGRTSGPSSVNTSKPKRVSSVNKSKPKNPSLLDYVVGQSGRRRVS